MKHLVESVLTASPMWIYLVVGLLVFVEDAVFVGFVIPGETAAVIGGVAASRSEVELVAMLAVVVGAAVLGDSVGYEVGKLAGPRILRARALERHKARLDTARALLARRGSAAVVLGRSVAFFRAVMPALAGIAQMPYRKFLIANAFGGLLWGGAVVLLGYLAGNSYERVEKTFGKGVSIGLAVIVVAALLTWFVRRHRTEATD
jgi:membrane protein DedA with SNARE-associated domain